MQYKPYKASDLFDCKNCGDCCIGFGGTFVDKDDIKKIAAYINTDTKKFVDRYCDISGKKFVLAVEKNGYCIFWDKKCSIHPVKPRMCRQWPFIKNVLADVSNWQIMAGVCPGIQKDIPDNIIKKIVAEELNKNDRHI